MSRRSPVLGTFFLLLVLGLALPVLGAEPPASMYSQMQWRMVGPFRGGWSTMAVGVPSEPNVFYFGGADGGVWKTQDAGLTWQALFQDGDSLSIGALAVAPSNPDILYIGTGQPEQSRYDTVEGTGVYRSDDGGLHWRSVGLSDTRHIGRIWVDPSNPDVVVVAALGHIFGPNEERGVFRSEDGGQHWSKVLYVDDNTGAVDLAADPAKPDVMYAATWQGRSWPWFAYYIPQQGPGSGVWKSTDAGKTWTKLAGNGLPGGSLGRIGIAVAPGTDDQRVYALIESSQEADTALYRSDDGGGHWKNMGQRDLVSGYFDRITVDPKNPDLLYVMNRSVARSDDGGKTFRWFKGAPGGDDYHFMWINPADDSHMVVASDQGTAISVDGGKSWSSWYNQPTGQFYHVTTDNRFPYHIYSGQQDSGTVEADSASDYGELTFRDWNSVGGDERSYVFPDNGDPNIVYVGGLGGHISRFDKRTGQSQNISAWPISGYGRRPTTVKYRYNWFYPVVADPHKAHVLYLGAQYVFKSEDEGMHWKIISPDLTGADPKSRDATGCDGNDLKLAQAKACGYGVIFSIAPSPKDSLVIWTGADDGVVELSRDGGKTWQDVSPKGMPAYGRVNQVEASPSDPATAYLAVDTHRQDVFQPFAFRTHDYGKTWTPIVEGLPAAEFVYAVRQDLKQSTLLYAGTNRGVYVSFDDGDHWGPLEGGLPKVRVRDLTLHGDDLIAATHGRGLWVLDDVASLRQVAAAQQGQAYLFQPATAVRMRRNENKDTPLPPEEPGAANPPEGAIIDYWLAPDVQGPVSLKIYDAKGQLVRSYASDAPGPTLDTELYFTDAWLTPPEKLAAEAGGHRFVWDLRYARPPALGYDYSIAAVWGQGGQLLPQGPLVLPGRYKVTLTAGGFSMSQEFNVVEDPRVAPLAAKAALPKQLKFEQQLVDAMRESYAGRTALADLRKGIAALLPQLQGSADGALAAQVSALDGKAEQLESKASKEHNFSSLNRRFASFISEVDDSDRAPPQQYLDAYAGYAKTLGEVLKSWQDLKQGDLAALNAALKTRGLAPLAVHGS
jgi:photosystem II stability/assembly factor-like uncharacterized protein